MSKIFSFSLYYTSFFPLWVSILFIDIKNCIESTSDLWTEKISIWLILFIALFSLIILNVSLKTNSKEGTTSQVLKVAKEEKSLTAEYLLSYILPLFTFDFTKWDQVVLFLIFFFTFGFLHIRHNYFSINIVLEIINFKFYRCELENEDGKPMAHRVISHRNLNGCIGNKLYLKSLNNDYKLDIHK